MGETSVLVNGNPETTLSVHDRSVQFGDGVFETVAVSNGQALALEEHIARLRTSASAIGLTEPDFAPLLDDIATLTDDASTAVLKIIVSAGVGGRGYQRADVQPTRIVWRYPWPEQYNATMIAEGINVRLCDTRLGHNPRLAGIKHANRLEQVLARNEWNDPEVAEGVMLDIDDNVVEGCASNIFIISDSALHTPALDRCGIQGTVRKLILNIAAELKIDVHVRKIHLDDLKQADGMFMCNSLMGICPVKKFRSTQYEMPELISLLREKLIQDKKIAAL